METEFELTIMRSWSNKYYYQFAFPGAFSKKVGSVLPAYTSCLSVSSFVFNLSMYSKYSYNFTSRFQLFIILYSNNLLVNMQVTYLCPCIDKYLSPLNIQHALNIQNYDINKYNIWVFDTYCYCDLFKNLKEC